MEITHFIIRIFSIYITSSRNFQQCHDLSRHSVRSRNSFVVLPITLVLPDAYVMAVNVIVLQSLIELFGMAVYVWMVPGRLFPD